MLVTKAAAATGTGVIIVSQVLPFVCSSVLVFQSEAWQPDSHILEDSIKVIRLIMFEYGW